MDTAPSGVSTPHTYELPSFTAPEWSGSTAGVDEGPSLVEIEVTPTAPQVGTPKKDRPGYRLRERLRGCGHLFWKWVFRVAMLSGIVTMVLTLVLVLR